LKRFAARICWLLLACYLLLPAVVQAGPMEEYQEARRLYLYAAACRASYDDYIGHIIFGELADNGWQMEEYYKISKKADAHFLIAHQIEAETGKKVYLMAASDTETWKDVLTDLMVGKVYFAGKTVEEFAANAARKEIPKGAPLVHQGFHHYVQAIFDAKDKNGLGDSVRGLTARLLQNPEQKLYMMGHSLGGATVTLAAARLISMGVRPEQLEVVTFGAPAVGNVAFRHQFEKVLPLTRIVNNGDPVSSVVQDLIGGYEQFGREQRWMVPNHLSNQPHDMLLYLDQAIRRYYDAQQKAVAAGVLVKPYQTPPAAGKPRVYVAPVRHSLPVVLEKEYQYMREALWGEYRDVLPGYVLDCRQAPAGETLAVDLQQAAAAGCQWLVESNLVGHTLRDHKNRYYLSLEQHLYRVADGQLVSLVSYASSTAEMTPLEASVHNSMEMRGDHAQWMDPFLVK